MSGRLLTRPVYSFKTSRRLSSNSEPGPLSRSLSRIPSLGWQDLTDQPNYPATDRNRGATILWTTSFCGSRKLIEHGRHVPFRVLEAGILRIVGETPQTSSRLTAEQLEGTEMAWRCVVSSAASVVQCPVFFITSQDNRLG